VGAGRGIASREKGGVQEGTRSEYDNTTEIKYLGKVKVMSFSALLQHLHFCYLKYFANIKHMQKTFF
jgi:hypothetical protein